MENTATLTSKGNYTTFSFNGEKIWFYTSPALVRYNRVKKWHRGYIEVMADYGQGEEEDYIDLVPILENLYIDAEEFLKPIEKVEVTYA